MSDRNEPHKSVAHKAYEDALAFLLGTWLCALGVQILTHLGLITGQTAGAAVLGAYVTDWSFGAVFFVLNLPFYVLAWWRMGWRFTLKTFAAVALVSLFSEVMPLVISFERIEPFTGALTSGAVIGLGLIIIFRHGASLGGIGQLA